MMVGVFFAVVALTFLIYLGGKIDISFIEHDAEKEKSYLGKVSQSKTVKMQSSGGVERRGNFQKGATGRASWLVASGLPQK